MGSVKIEPVKSISGAIVLPGDKSISHRAVIIGSIAEGTTRVRNLLDCDDCRFTINAFKKMGVSIRTDKDETVIAGKGLRGLKSPGSSLHLGNSGTSMRLLAGIIAGQNFETRLGGDTSLSNRPMTRIVEPLSAMGVDIEASTGGLPPLRVRGGEVKSISYRMPIPSAQVKSAVLFAGLYARGVTTVEEAFKSRDHTERMLRFYGADITVEGLKISVNGGAELKGMSFDIPGDISSASFFMAGAAILKDSAINIRGVNLNPTRMGILNIMSRMGVKVMVSNRSESFEPVGDVEVRTGKTKGTIIEAGEIPGMIDELPMIFVLAALSKGTTVIEGAGELRVKETDRINSMKYNLEKMGGIIKVDKDEIIIEGVEELKGSNALRSFGDHRTCMAMAIAALAARGRSEIDDASCISKSFPGFFDILENLKR